MKKISLTQNKYALVDDEDYEDLNQFKWYYCNGYAYRTENIGVFRGKIRKKTIAMHREVNKTPKGLVTDHINRKTLDNKKINLRSCTDVENCRNTKITKNSSSRFKGVSWDKSREKWAAYIKINWKKRYLGRFSSEKCAARAYNKSAEELFGEFARLNKI